jgi:hypothetical protein
VSMDLLSGLLPNPVLDTDVRTTELCSQMLTLTKLESLFAYWQEES